MKTETEKMLDQALLYAALWMQRALKAELEVELLRISYQRGSGL